MSQYKKISQFALIGLVGASTSTWAGYQVHSPGPMMTLGKTTHPSTILSATGNPAGGAVLIGDKENLRLGYLSSIGAQAEFGDADNFLDEVDELKDALDEENITISRANEIKNQFDALLPKLGEDARVTVQADVHAPLMPVLVKSETLGGTLSFGVQGAGIFDVRFLDDPIQIQQVGGDVTVETASALYIKGASIATGSLGYSRMVWEPAQVPNSKVYAGAQLNVYHGSLNKQVLAVQNMLDDEDVDEAVKDEFDENTVKTTQVGLDLGVLWQATHWQAGVTFANLNEPEFDYGEIGVNCGTIADPVRQANCIVAQQTFSDEIDLNETATMNMQTTVDGSIFTSDKHWQLSAAADLNSTYDLVGRETQYVSTSASYLSGGYLVPNVRLGVSKNLVGSELTTVGFGLTLFGVMNIDLAASLEQTEVDGSKVPRNVGFNIGFEEKF